MLNKSCLVTGGAGFIGSNLAAGLLEKGYSVRVFDNLETGRLENLAAISGDVDFVEGDITNADAIRDAMEGVDYLFHQAALPSVARSVEDPAKTNQINVVGTMNVLNAARAAGVRKVMYASSSSVYGDTPVLPKQEDMTPCPISPYGVSKLTGEYYCLVFDKCYGIPAVALRYFNVFGPNQDETSEYAAVIPKFISRLLRKEAPIIYGDGLQTRDFTFVKDVVQANIRAAEKPAHGRAFNIAYQTDTSLLTLLDQIQDIMGVKIPPLLKPGRVGDVRRSIADISAARKALGYRPGYDLKGGLEQTVVYLTKLLAKQ